MSAKRRRSCSSCLPRPSTGNVVTVIGRGCPGTAVMRVRHRGNLRRIAVLSRGERGRICFGRQGR